MNKLRASQKSMLALINHCLVDNIWLSYRHVKSHTQRKYARHTTLLRVRECIFCVWWVLTASGAPDCVSHVRCECILGKSCAAHCWCVRVQVCVCLVMFFFFFISRFISNPPIYSSVAAKLFSHFYLSMLYAIVTTAAAAPVSMWMCAIELKLCMCHIFAFTYTDGTYGRMSSYWTRFKVDSFATMYSTIQSSTTERSVQVGTHILSLR